MFAQIWVQDDQASNKYVALLENENFLSLCSIQFKLSLIQKLSLFLFPLAHNLTSKTGIFFVLQRVATQTYFSTESKAPVAKIYHNIHFSCCYS